MYVLQITYVYHIHMYIHMEDINTCVCIVKILFMTVEETMSELNI